MSDIAIFTFVAAFISAIFTFLGVVYSTRSRSNDSENKDLSEKMDRVWNMYSDMFEKFEMRCTSLENQVAEYRAKIVIYEMEIKKLKDLLDEQRITVEQYKIEKETAEGEVSQLEQRINQLEIEIQSYKKAG